MVHPTCAPVVASDFYSYIPYHALQLNLLVHNTWPRPGSGRTHRVTRQIVQAQQKVLPRQVVHVFTKVLFTKLGWTLYPGKEGTREDTVERVV